MLSDNLTALPASQNRVLYRVTVEYEECVNDMSIRSLQYRAAASFSKSFGDDGEM